MIRPTFSLGKIACFSRYMCMHASQECYQHAAIFVDLVMQPMLRCRTFFTWVCRHMCSCCEVLSSVPQVSRGTPGTPGTLP